MRRKQKGGHVTRQEEVGSNMPYCSFLIPFSLCVCVCVCVVTKRTTTNTNKQITKRFGMMPMHVGFPTPHNNLLSCFQERKQRECREREKVEREREGGVMCVT